MIRRRGRALSKEMVLNLEEVMRKILPIAVLAGMVLGTVGGVVTVLAQDSGQSPPQGAPEYTLRVTGAEAQVIFEAIQERSFRSVAPLVGKIQSQVSEQIKAQANGQGPTPARAPEGK
jgi:hypothetical protein